MTTATTTKERPILFSGAMVRAILDGTKTQTRRVMKDWVKHPHLFEANTTIQCNQGVACWVRADMRDSLGGPCYIQSRCPYGQPGDRLWVRETWAHTDYEREGPFQNCTIYRADGEDGVWDAPGYRWRPSIHMPRWASRITLEITGVRVEQVQDITPDDAYAEGIREVYYEHAVGAFRVLWDSINAARGYGWASNPWVWVVEFRRVQP